MDLNMNHYNNIINDIINNINHLANDNIIYHNNQNIANFPVINGPNYPYTIHHLLGVVNNSPVRNQMFSYISTIIDYTLYLTRNANAVYDNHYVHELHNRVNNLNNMVFHPLDQQVITDIFRIIVQCTRDQIKEISNMINNMNH
jgi:hypothetical protein